MGLLGFKGPRIIFEVFAKGLMNKIIRQLLIGFGERANERMGLIKHCLMRRAS